MSFHLHISPETRFLRLPGSFLLDAGKRALEAADQRRGQRHGGDRREVVDDHLAGIATALEHRREPAVESLVADALEVERRREQDAPPARVVQLVRLRGRILGRRGGDAREHGGTKIDARVVHRLEHRSALA